VLVFINSNKKEFAMKITKILSAITLTAASLAINSAAQAATVDEYTTASAEFAQAYNNGSAISLTIEGAGVNRTVTLAMSNYTYGIGSTYWVGTIPAESVVDDGIAQISVNVDTCLLTPRATYGTDPCGLVDVTFTKNDYLWKTNGVTQYVWGDIIYQIIGGVSTFSAAATGTVRGVDISTPRAYMGKFTDVSVTVTTAN